MENDLAILEVEDLEQEEDVEVEEKVPKEVVEKVEEAKHIQEHHKEEVRLRPNSTYKSHPRIFTAYY